MITNYLILHRRQGVRALYNGSVTKRDNRDRLSDDREAHVSCRSYKRDT